MVNTTPAVPICKTHMYIDLSYKHRPVATCNHPTHDIIMGYHLRTRVAPSPNTTHAKKKRTLKRAAAASQPILLLDLPLAVLNAVLVLLEGKDLGKLQCAISSRQLTVRTS